jgi:hypothetical protein
MILAEIWRKNMDPIKESERTRTMKGSLVGTVGVSREEKKGVGEGHVHSEPR